MCTIITVSQLTMSGGQSSVRNLKVLVLCSSMTSTEELKLIQIRHRDVSTKNKTVTLLANVLQRLTERRVVLRANVTKLQKCVCYCKGGKPQRCLSNAPESCEVWSGPRLLWEPSNCRSPRNKHNIWCNMSESEDVEVEGNDVRWTLRLKVLNIK